MSKILFIGFVFLTQLVFCSERKDLYQIYTIDSVVLDPTIATDNGALTFNFKNYIKETNESVILYACNGIEGSFTPNAKNNWSISLKTGKYAFQFYTSTQYYEIYTDSIPVSEKHRTFISVYLQRADREIIVDKPIIYLYPEQPYLVEVKVNPVGKLTFTYPEYKEGWSVEATPSGEMLVDGKRINYLFWESTQLIDPTSIDLTSGFIVDQKNIVSFLEEKLTCFGLTDQEKLDFITFWGPQLVKYERNYIHFILNDQCDQFAELNISPQPTHIYRIYIVSSPISSSGMINVTPQVIPKMDRSGFTVIEWGGSRLDPSFLNITLN